MYSLRLAFWCATEKSFAARAATTAWAPFGVASAATRNGLGVAADEDERLREAVSEESRFRGANERFRRVLTTYHFEADARAPFICECADPSCFKAVMVSLKEYDRVRANPTWFVLAVGHEDAEAGHQLILEVETGYTIVEKIGPS